MAENNDGSQGWEDEIAPIHGESPRPWRVNDAWLTRESSNSLRYLHTPTLAPILDANGKPVMHTSEWLTLSPENAALIVEAVNARG